MAICMTCMIINEATIHKYGNEVGICICRLSYDFHQLIVDYKGLNKSETIHTRKKLITSFITKKITENKYERHEPTKTNESKKI